jgi:hypothetical protein
MSKQPKFCNKYDKMTLQEKKEALDDFSGLSDEAMDAIGKVADIFIKKYAPQNRELPKQRRDIQGC